MKNNSNKLSLLFFLEGNADIRFIKGLSERFNLILMGPKSNIEQSGLLERINRENLNLKIEMVEGGRFSYQIKSFLRLLRIRGVEVILAQEVLRGALNANLISFIRGIPCINHTGISPIEYYSFRYYKNEIGLFRYFLGVSLIKSLMILNGVFSSLWVVVGPYLPTIAQKYTDRYVVGKIYGVDTDFFSPVEESKKMELRDKLKLPKDKFIILLSSRISHEKDPETVLKSIEALYLKGLPVFLVNLAGSHKKLIELANKLQIKGRDQWLDARGAVHPMYELAEYYQASDMVIQASLAEGCGISPLEGLACGIPVVATRVGGMAAQLEGRCLLFDPKDHEQVVFFIENIINHYSKYKDAAMKQRQWVVRTWNNKIALEELEDQVRDLLNNTIKTTSKLIES